MKGKNYAINVSIKNTKGVMDCIVNYADAL